MSNMEVSAKMGGQLGTRKISVFSWDPPEFRFLVRMAYFPSI
jgi:hypothetical protein